MNASIVQTYGIAAAALVFIGWRYLRFRGVKKALPELLKRGAVIVDVRTPGEFLSGSSRGSINIPLGELEKDLSRLNPENPVIVCCASGMRSATACSILKRRGFKVVVNAGPWTNTVV